MNDDDATSEDEELKEVTDDVEVDGACTDEEANCEESVAEMVRGEEDCGKEVKETETILVVDEPSLLIVSAVNVDKSAAESEVMEGAVLDVVLTAANSCERTLSGSVDKNAIKVSRHIHRLERKLSLPIQIPSAIPKPPV